MPMKSTDIEVLVALLRNREIGGDLARVGSQESVKSKFKRLSVAYLKDLAARLGFKRGDFEVKFNPGGPGVSGEAYLYSVGAFVMLSGGPGPELGVLYRRCDRVFATGAKAKQGTATWSHTRSGNQWMPLDALIDVDRVASLVRTVMPQAGAS